MARRIVNEVPGAFHPIRPEHIKLGQFWDAFGNSETEVSALWIVRLCQQNGAWKPFTHDEIESFYRENSKFTNFTFNRLVDGQYGYVVLVDGKYHVTHEFICRCFASSPNIFPE